MNLASMADSSHDRPGLFTGAGGTADEAVPPGQAHGESAGTRDQGAVTGAAVLSYQCTVTGAESGRLRDESPTATV
jgi:hypothetical protein